MTPPRAHRHSAVLAAALVVGLGAASAAPPARALASPWAENPESRVRLVTPYRVAPAEGEVRLGLHFRLTPEWHVYWKNSGDAGFPPALDLADTPELAGAELLWPAPERYELPGDLVAFGYEDEVIYPVRATLAAAGRDWVEIAATLDYLVCRVDCIPYRYTLRVDQPVGPEAEADPETAPLLEHWQARVPVPADELPEVETDGRLDLDDLRRPVLTVTVAGARAAPGERPELFLEAHDLFDPDRPELQESPSGLLFRVPMEVNRRLDEAPESATFAWTVTGLARPAGTASAEGDGPLSIEATRTVPAGAGEAPAAAPGTEAAGRGAPAGSASRAGLVLLALAGGLVLAATPGALALVLVLLGSLRRLAVERPGEVLPRASMVAAGTLAAGLVLAAADVATPGSGWSRLLQAPLAITGLALVGLLFALGLWGFLGRRPDRQAENAPPRPAASGRAAALAAGALLPALALPWPLPPAATSLDRAAGMGPAVVVATALAVAAGLALPILAGALLLRRGAAAAAGPRPAGRRLEALGFLAAASVVWLLYVLSGLLDSEDLAFVELSFLALGLAAWGRGRSARPAGRWAWGALAAIAGAAALWLAAVG